MIERKRLTPDGAAYAWRALIASHEEKVHLAMRAATDTYPFSVDGVVGLGFGDQRKIFNRQAVAFLRELADALEREGDPPR